MFLVIMLLLIGRYLNSQHSSIQCFYFDGLCVTENYDYLERLLKELTFEDRCKDVSGWSNSGEVVLEYLGVVRQVNEALAARDPSIGYHLERLQNQLKDLCLKIKLMKANTPLDRSVIAILLTILQVKEALSSLCAGKFVTSHNFIVGQPAHVNSA